MIDLSIDIPEKPILQKDRDLVIQQIDLLFDTNKEEVFGEPNFGTNFEEFLWDLNVSSTYIRNYVYRAIVDNVNLLGYSVNVDVQIMQGTLNDIILIQISLRRDGDYLEKTYKMQ